MAIWSKTPRTPVKAAVTPEQLRAEALAQARQKGYQTEASRAAEAVERVTKGQHARDLREAEQIGKQAAHLEANEAIKAIKNPALKTAETNVVKQVEKQTEKELGLLARTRKAAFGGKVGKVGKWLAIGGAAMGGLLILSNRGKSDYRPSQHADNIPPLQPVMQPDMIAGPAEGRSNNEWQNRVRGQQQQMVGPNQPIQNVAEAQDLGPVPTR